jgi:hypothetical protein
MQKKLTPFLISLFILLLLFFFVRIQLGEGYRSKPSPSPFDVAAFFSALEPLTGELFI